MQPDYSTVMCLEPDGPSRPTPPAEHISDTPMGELMRQSDVMRGLGAPFVADLLAAAERQLDHAPRTARLIRSWGSTAASSAIAMRVNAALHALARHGAVPLLSSLYAGKHRRFDDAVAQALARHDDLLVAWLHQVPQTNEVGRAAAFQAALMRLARDHGHGFELLEIGASAGLNLNLSRYAYDLGGVRTGQPDSPVRIAPQWCGTPPPDVPVVVAKACGVDLHPVDIRDPGACERLASFVFADQPERAARLGHALALARHYPPRVDAGHAAPWLAARLAMPPVAAGRHRVVLHSMVLQYVATDERAAMERTLADAARGASPAYPLACVGFEWDARRERVELRLRSWPDGGDRILAYCHPYGAWIDWQDA
ncbi:DUF2332 family protein [Sphingomonas sp.]|uniref:DUF2332 domain-containing protein n=1 Tax=Sphingomonas sp. TaxID=28214 RepID=UPI00289A2705|nr:DUF2332 family protein [Sphingomonas sp.]